MNKICNFPNTQNQRPCSAIDFLKKNPRNFTQSLERRWGILILILVLSGPWSALPMARRLPGCWRWSGRGRSRMGSTEGCPGSWTGSGRGASSSGPRRPWGRSRKRRRRRRLLGRPRHDAWMSAVSRAELTFPLLVLRCYFHDQERFPPLSDELFGKIVGDSPLLIFPGRHLLW